jgi:S-adenosylmethionine synthetase
MSYQLITCESVSDGHPDKIADQISDAILDAALALDANARVACEVMVKDKWICLSGEITLQGKIDYQQVVMQVLSDIYHIKITPSDFDLETHISEQSPEIAYGVDHDGQIGAGDQGVMYGYACNENNALMPMPALLSHQLMQQQKKMRQQHQFLGADAKAQVTLVYDHHSPIYIDTVLVSTQHTDQIQLDELRDWVVEYIITPVMPKHLWHEKTKVIVNPAGSFIQGGPSADCGLTGRKIIVDTYGGVAHHGGGAFSGKDATKVDRTAAYMARYVAKHIVASGVAKRCEVQLAYAIGQSQPVAISIDTFGTHTISEQEILDVVKASFDFSIKAMIDKLDLTKPVFTKSARFGHFGREGFAWERLCPGDMNVFKNQ